MGFNVSSDLSAALSSMLIIGGGQVIECFSQPSTRQGSGAFLLSKRVFNLARMLRLGF